MDSGCVVTSESYGRIFELGTTWFWRSACGASPRKREWSLGVEVDGELDVQGETRLHALCLNREGCQVGSDIQSLTGFSLVVQVERSFMSWLCNFRRARISDQQWRMWRLGFLVDDVDGREDGVGGAQGRRAWYSRALVVICLRSLV